MDNVHISNVYAEVPATKPDAGYDYEGPTEDNPRNVSPSGIVGLQDNKITNVSIENVEIVYPGGGNPLYAKVGLDELDKVPEMPKLILNSLSIRSCLPGDFMSAMPMGSLSRM